jgi:imidazoleglycerol-phosphate dehydratase
LKWFKKPPRLPSLSVRNGAITRKTKETGIEVSVDLDGTGAARIATGIGFFDHMLEQLARHSLMDIEIRATGDLHIDQHHTVEDTGIALGQAVRQALGGMEGIARFADVVLPMDETLTRVAVDISGRPFLVFRTKFPQSKTGTFDTELVREFFQAFTTHAAMNIHVETLYGENAHHIAESLFKGLARALRAAVELDHRQRGAVPSTKGTLSG